MKECGECGITQPLDNFRRINKRTGGRYRSDCKRCENSARRAYRATAPGKRTRYELNVWDKYGVTPEQLTKLILESEGRCGMCSGQLRTFHLDHHHASGLVRELLCPRCNMVIGIVQTSGGALLKLAIAYIRKHAQLRRSK